MTSITQIATVSFHDHSLTVITDNDQRLVAMRPICEGIGLVWSGQYERIKRDEVLSSCVRVIRTQLSGDTQSRNTVFLPLDYLNGWLFGIDVSRCREEIRPTLIKYKRECYAALAAYWQEGEAKRPRQRQPKALPNGLTIEQQDAIKGLVKARVEALPENKRAKAAITLWSSLKSKFGCTYKQIEPELYSDAVSLVARVTLDGEYIQREETPTRRMLISRDHTGKEQITPVPDDACVMTTSQMLRAMTEPNGLIISTEELADFISAATGQLRQRTLWQEELLRQMRTNEQRSER